MTKDELRAKYNVAYRIIMRERAMRDHVFGEGGSPEQGAKRGEKLLEMDRLLEVVTELKDALKEAMERVEYQPKLLDIPRRESYGG
jgi:hypothetical protein